MITEYFLSALYGLAYYLVSVLPNPETLPSQIDDAFTAISTYWPTASAFFPLSTLFTILGLGLSIELSILGFKMSNWVFDKIRGAG